jgi:hypothetical protein
MNAVRRSLGEFDEMARAKGLNSTFSDFSGRGAELYSLGKLQDATQAVLESKSSEILSIAKGVSTPYAWKPIADMISDTTLASMNKLYSSMQPAIEAAKTHINTTIGGLGSPQPNRLIAGQANEISAAENMARQGARQGLATTAINKMFPPKVPNTRGMQFDANLQRVTSPVTEVLDTMLLRDKPVPIISRNWESVKLDRGQMLEVGVRAAKLGLLPMGAFEAMSEPLKHKVFEMVVSAFADENVSMALGGTVETAPEGLNLVDNKYQNPMEKDAIVSRYLDAPPEERFKYIGSSFQNKYPETTPAVQPQPMQSGMDISQFNSILGRQEPTDLGVVGLKSDATSMIDRLNEITAIHDMDIQ